MTNKRRKFLGFLTAAVAAPYLPAGAAPVRRAPLSGPDKHLIHLLLQIVPDNPAARQLGYALTDRPPTEPDLHQRFARLFGELPRNAQISADDFRWHLENMRQADFAGGDTVTADGWILARSEADAIALAAAHRDN